jgi:peptidyl-prolyl cis-trans isomerase D
MLEAFRRGKRWWTAAVVVFVGGVFAVFIGLGGPLQSGSGGALVVVGNVRVGADEYERVRRQQIDYFERVLGEQFDPRKLGEDMIDGATIRLLVERAILAQEAEAMGLVVAKQEIERGLLAQPGLRGPDGRFDKEAFDNWIYREFGNERSFSEQQRRALLAQKLLRVLSTQAAVSEGEARDAVEIRLEQVKLVAVVLDTAGSPESFERDEGAIAGFLTTREEEARTLYEKRSEDFNTPEQTRARHILLRMPADASDEARAEFEQQAQELIERIQAGEDFATLAQERSDDPGSKANGGDLGYFARGTMVAEFEEAAFTLEPGTLSGPVHTDYGIHIIRVEDRKPAQSRSFEEVREDLAFEILGEAAGRDAAWEQARGLSEAVRGGEPLEDAARAADLTLERTDWIQRRPDGFVPGIGTAQELLAVAFVLEPGTSSARIFEVGDKLALVHVAEREGLDEETIALEIEIEQTRLQQQKLNTLSDTWVKERQNALTQSGQLQVNIELGNNS